MSLSTGVRVCCGPQTTLYHRVGREYTLTAGAPVYGCAEEQACSLRRTPLGRMILSTVHPLTRVRGVALCEGSSDAPELKGENVCTGEVWATWEPYCLDDAGRGHTAGWRLWFAGLPTGGLGTAPDVGGMWWLSLRTALSALNSGLFFNQEPTLKRRTVPVVDSAEGVPATAADCTSKLLGPLGNVMMHLAVIRYDDGTPRRPGRLFLETQGSTWVVCLKEPDAGLELRCSGQTLDDALAAADLLLGSDQCPWQPDSWAQQRSQSGKRRSS